MSTVAEQLHVAREAQGLTVQQVADAIKIRADHIGALEQGDFSVFSAPIYIRGSVKNYAKLLKLDLPPLMAALDIELGRTEKFSEPPPFTDESKKPLDRVIYLLAKLNLKWALAMIRSATCRPPVTNRPAPAIPCRCLRNKPDARQRSLK
jgi:cytoskeletal protein RodZ